VDDPPRNAPATDVEMVNIEAGDGGRSRKPRELIGNKDANRFRSNSAVMRALGGGGGDEAKKVGTSSNPFGTSAAENPFPPMRDEEGHKSGAETVKDGLLRLRTKKVFGGYSWQMTYVAFTSDARLTWNKQDPNKTTRGSKLGECMLGSFDVAAMSFADSGTDENFSEFGIGLTERGTRSAPEPSIAFCPNSEAERDAWLEVFGVRTESSGDILASVGRNKSFVEAQKLNQMFF
jgi:hypothetical protein